VTTALGVDAAMALAYSSAAASWRSGPDLVYGALAHHLVACSPVSLRGARVVDIGAGTGAASRAALGAGAADVVAVDAASGMLAVDAVGRPPAVVDDATRLPFGAAAFDVALAAFSFNHLRDPAAGLREAARVVRPGGAVLASAYAHDDDHPVKGAADRALRRAGWRPPPWQAEIYGLRAPQLATRGACEQACALAGLDAEVRAMRVPFPSLTADQLVQWRLGMAQHAAFVGALSDHERHALEREVVASLTDAQPLVRSIMVMVARR
jgi:ubiquinone/menaquinone biosynthesis C-methylase UbiE